MKVRSLAHTAVPRRIATAAPAQSSGATDQFAGAATTSGRGSLIRKGCVLAGATLGTLGVGAYTSSLTGYAASVSGAATGGTLGAVLGAAAGGFIAVSLVDDHDGWWDLAAGIAGGTAGGVLGGAGGGYTGYHAGIGYGNFHGYAAGALLGALAGAIVGKAITAEN